MFLSDSAPVIITLPTTHEYVDLYFIHDAHYGSELFDEKKWNRVKNLILNDENAYVCFIGDLFENAIPNSKSDIFSQTHSPAEQKEWVTQQLTDLAHKTIIVVPGNHESNRTTKVSGLYPLYDCCLLAGIGEKYRDTIGFIDIGVGTYRGRTDRQTHYFGQVQHKAKDLKNYHSSDYTDGIDFFCKRPRPRSEG